MWPPSTRDTVANSLARPLSDSLSRHHVPSSIRMVGGNAVASGGAPLERLHGRRNSAGLTMIE